MDRRIVIVCVNSFLAAALASTGQFCFAAVASGSIVLILPGYIVLCGSLELANRSIISGSVRLVFSVLYSYVYNCPPSRIEIDNRSLTASLLVSLSRQSSCGLRLIIADMFAFSEWVVRSTVELLVWIFAEVPTSVPPFSSRSPRLTFCDVVHLLSPSSQRALVPSDDFSLVL